MKNVLRTLTFTTLLLFATSALAADRVVVIPLGSTKNYMYWQGDWATNTIYKVGDAVHMNGSSYMCTAVHTSTMNDYPPYEAYWALIAAEGNQGEKGEQGPIGADGAQGPQGLTGPAGADGATGVQGPQGLTGPAGADGAPGAQGPQGLTGPAGADGAPGAQGPQGLTGPAGADGAPGAGLTMVDSNGTHIGQVLSADQYQFSVSTSTGYIVGFTWDDQHYPAQSYWTGASCTGIAYLNDGNGGGGGDVIYGKSAFWSGVANSYMVPYSVEANGTSVSVSFTSATIENPTCIASAGSNSGWRLKTITNADLGLPDTIVLPFVFQ